MRKRADAETQKEVNVSALFALEFPQTVVLK